MDATPAYSRAFCEPQYNQRLNVPDRPASMARRQELCERVRRDLRSTLDIPYGESALERLDIYPAADPDAPVMVFIHGGYWQRFDKADVAFLAEPFVRAGVTLVNVNYDLCPTVTLDRIVAQVRAACAWVWRHVADHGGDPDRIFVSGNSAGGHLTAMMMATDWPALDAALPRDVLKGGLAISGIYDLEPLRYTSINDAVGLDADAARRNSPVMMQPPTGAPVVVAVGALESPEFQRQTRALAAAWKAAGTDSSARTLVVPGCHHFNILLDLAEPGSLLMQAALDLMQENRNPRREGCPT
ncbi:MAG: alpha/beta hydrolase [bacterium]|jgi:arylformamidase|nr:alpha/beta hydrolase [Betaproteobacteria bacterium]